MPDLGLSSHGLIRCFKIVNSDALQTKILDVGKKISAQPTARKKIEPPCRIRGVLGGFRDELLGFLIGFSHYFQKSSHFFTVLDGFQMKKFKLFLKKIPSGFDCSRFTMTKFSVLGIFTEDSKD